VARNGDSPWHRLELNQKLGIRRSHIVRLDQVRSPHPSLELGDRRPYHVSNSALADTLTVVFIVVIVDIRRCCCYINSLIIGYNNSIRALLKAPQGFKGITTAIAAVPCHHDWFRNVFNLDLRLVLRLLIITSSSIATSSLPFLFEFALLFTLALFAFALVAVTFRR
jgi:hypothetical protein